MSDLTTRLRTACDQVRVKSYPLSDLIPLMQQAADAIAAAPAQPAPSAPQPSPTPQADSQPAPVQVEMHEAKCPALIGDKCTCAKADHAVDSAWARFCAGIGDGPNAPYPGMIGAFERYYSQSFADRDWHKETSVWAAAWKACCAARAPADRVLEDAARLEALHAAVTAIYLDDSSDFKSALGAVVRHLDPKLAGDLLAWPKRAYDISQARLDAARKQGANHD